MEGKKPSFEAIDRPSESSAILSHNRQEMDKLVYKISFWIATPQISQRTIT